METTRAQHVLVVGATGFVGRALVPALVARGHAVSALVRDPGRGREKLPPEARLIRGDLLDPASLEPAVRGASTVFYLAHSMGAGDRSVRFEVRDRQAAENLVRSAAAAGVARIIYVGGLGDESAARSPHLESRREVARILASGSPELTTLRAAIVVGAGGSSFEMIVQLVEHLPLMVSPQWIRTRCQPIALEDLVGYLVGCLEAPETAGRSFDVGGPDTLPYSELLHRIGDRLGRRSRILVLPILTPGLSAHWVGLITEVPSSMARDLVEGMRTEVVCRENRIRGVLPRPLLSYDEAVDKALESRPLRPLRLRQLLARWIGTRPGQEAIVDLRRAIGRSPER